MTRAAASAILRFYFGLLAQDPDYRCEPVKG